MRFITGKRCPILQEKLLGIRGLGLTEISFRCDKREALFTPGQCVEFQVWDRGVSEYREDPLLIECEGWVWKTEGCKVVVVSQATNIPVLKFYPDALKLVPGEERRCCIHCAKPEGVADAIRGKHDSEPHAYVCRYEHLSYDDGGDLGLPCEYPAVEMAGVEA